MYVDIAISNIFHLNKHFLFLFSFSLSTVDVVVASCLVHLPRIEYCGHGVGVMPRALTSHCVLWTWWGRLASFTYLALCTVDVAGASCPVQQYLCVGVPQQYTGGSWALRPGHGNPLFQFP